MNEKLQYLKDVLDRARNAGLCRTQTEFAQKLGVTKSTISAALSGDEKYLTKSLISRTHAWAREVGLEESAIRTAAQPADKRPDIVIPAETLELYTAMAKSIDRLSALVDRLAPGADAVPRAHAEFQKNFRPEP